MNVSEMLLYLFDCARRVFVVYDCREGEKAIMFIKTFSVVRRWEREQRE